VKSETRGGPRRKPGKIGYKRGYKKIYTILDKRSKCDMRESGKWIPPSTRDLSQKII